MPTPTQPRAAKTAALCTVALSLLGPLALVVVPSKTTVAGDLAATSALQVASPSLVRLGLGAELGIVAVELVMIAALYLLFRPVSRDLARGAALARLGMAAVQGGVALAGFVALEAFLGGRTSDAGELLALRATGTLVWQALFGLHCAALAVLIARSRLVPRALGALMALSALGYLVLGVGALALPSHRALFGSPPVTVAMLGELPFYLWLLFRGIRPAAPASAPTEPAASPAL